MAARLCLPLLLLPAFLLAPVATAFEQNGAFIDSTQDTNTQNDFVFADWARARAAKEEAREDSANNIRIFVLPHSHDDPGWVRTSDQYFEFFVKPMYTTAVQSLLENPKRKFQVVEVIYFRQWYMEMTPEVQKQAHTLVENGQFTFAVGGWVMPDEAAVDYPDLINTMAMGQEWLYTTFPGLRVRHGFQVDPFGASSAFAVFSSKCGFESHLVARFNYFDKGWMQDTKNLEYIWRPSDALYQSPDKLEIFTHMMDMYAYSSPGIPQDAAVEHLCAKGTKAEDCPGAGFYWDGDDGNPYFYWAKLWETQGYGPYPAVNSTSVQFYADILVNNSLQRADWFATENVLWPFGTDFQHFNASAMFYSMDQIIEYVSAQNGEGQRYEGVQIQYAGLGDYFEAVAKSKASGWAVRGSGDFLPYSTLNCNGLADKTPGPCSGDSGPQYNVSWPQTWSGFYTSHMYIKIQQREAARKLRATAQLVSLLELSSNPVIVTGSDIQGKSEDLNKLRQAVGLLPHHDALTGTMGPGCGNGASKLPRVGYGSEKDLANSTEQDVQSGDTCPTLPVGRPGDIGEVAGDYSHRMKLGTDLADKVSADAAQKLLSKSGPNGAPKLSTDDLSFKMALKAGNSASLAVQNPLAWPSVRWVRLDVPANIKDVEVTDGAGKTVEHDLLQGGANACIGEDAKKLCAAAKRANEGSVGAGEDQNSLYFRAEVPPMGLAVFHISPKLKGEGQIAPVEITDGNATVEGNAYVVKFEGGKLVQVEDTSTQGMVIPLTQELKEYPSYDETVNKTSGDSWHLTATAARSGSYLLHPGSVEHQPVSGAFEQPKLEVVRGKYVVEIRQWFSPTHTQVWRMYIKESDGVAGGFLELQVGAGPLLPNRELLSVFDTKGKILTGIKGANCEDKDELSSTFYSDSNGFQLQKRVYSAYRSFPDGSCQKISSKPTEVLALNYYPMVRSAHIRDDEKMLSILTQQSQGVSSQKPGQLEVMVHRRSAQDDSKGACQVFNATSGGYANIPLDDSEGTSCQNFQTAGTCRSDNCPAYAVPMNISTRVEPLYYILVGQRDTMSRWRPISQQLNNLPPVLYFDSEATGFAPSFSPLGEDSDGLPSGIHLVSLETRIRDQSSSTDIIFRLQHIGSHEESEPIKVDFELAGFCELFGKTATYEEVDLNGLPSTQNAFDKLSPEGPLLFSADESRRLDLVGSRGAAYETRMESMKRTEYDETHASAGTKQSAKAPICGSWVRIWPEDIRTFVVHL